jgi:hypothetical protein
MVNQHDTGSFALFQLMGYLTSVTVFFFCVFCFMHYRIIIFVKNRRGYINDQHFAFLIGNNRLEVFWKECHESLEGQLQKS